MIFRLALPFVTVYPVTQFHVPGEDVTLQCHAAGVPTPKVSWELNEESLPTENEEHYRLLSESASETKKTLFFSGSCLLNM